MDADQAVEISGLDRNCAALARLARLLYKRDLTELCGGNVSCRRAGRIYITPTYASEYFLWDLNPGDICVLDEKGDIVRGSKANLSRETELHVRIYQANPGIHSVYHLHTAEIIALGNQADGMTNSSELRDFLTNQHINLCVLNPGLTGQTRPHDDAVLELIHGHDSAQVTIVIAPRHGLFSVCADPIVHLRTVDSLAGFVDYSMLRRHLARSGA